MNHQEVRKRMGEYLQGDLTLKQRALLDAHLDGCPACAKELQALRTTVQLLRGLPTPEVPRHLADRVFARIEDGEGRSRWWDALAAFWDAIDPARYLPPLAAAAVTSAAVIVGVRDLGWEIPGMRAPTPQLAAVQVAPEAAPTVRRSPPETAAAADRARASGFASELRMPAATEPAPRFERGEATGLIQHPFGARAASAPSAAGRAAPSPDEDLELALLDPQAFLERFHAMRPPETQNAWLLAVAERAAQQRSVEDVARRLREAAGAEGHALAVRFEGAAQAIDYPGEPR